jgi:hypothetical protein
MGSRTLSRRWLLVGLLVSGSIYAWYVTAQYMRLNDLHQRELADAAAELKRTVENTVETLSNLKSGDISCEKIDGFLEDQHYLKPLKECADKATPISADRAKAEVDADGIKISRGLVSFRFRTDSVLGELSFPESFRWVAVADQKGSVFFQDEPARRRWLRQLRWGEQNFRDSGADQSADLQVRNLADVLEGTGVPTWKQISSATVRTRMTFGGIWAQLYLQPVILEGSGAGNLVLAGAVPSQEIIRQALAVDTYFVALMVIVFVLGTFGFPFVKLITLERNERFRLRDVYLLYMSTAALLALLTFLVAASDAYYRWNREADQGLKTFADDAENKLQGELAAAQSQLVKYDQTLPSVFAESHKENCDQWDVRNQWFNNSTDAHFTPLENQVYIETVSWIGPDGKQIWKITSGKSNSNKIDVPERPYFRAARDGNLYRTKNSGAFFFTPDRSITDGKFYTFLSIPSQLPAGFCGQGTKEDDYVAAATLNLVSIDRTPLPPGYGFAIVNREGRVLYHSDDRLSLRENFFNELSKGTKVKAAIYAGRKACFSSQYRERPHRIFVKPFGVSLSLPQDKTDGPNEEPAGLFLAVFRDVSIERTEVARVVTTSLVGPMILLLAVSGIAFYVMARMARRTDGRPGAWLWPHGGLQEFYQTLTIGFIIVLLLGIAITFMGALDVACLFMPLAASVIGIAVYHSKNCPNQPRKKLSAPGWQTAMVALLLISVVVAPCWILFDLAITHEFGKLIHVGQRSMSAQAADGPLADGAKARGENYAAGISEKISQARLARSVGSPNPYAVNLQPKHQRAHWILRVQEWLDDSLPVDDNAATERLQEADFTYTPAGLFSLHVSWVAIAGVAAILGLMFLWIRWNTNRLFHADLECPAYKEIPSKDFEHEWNQCSTEERYVLLQVAREKIANPYQRRVVEALLSKRLLRLSPDLQPNSDAFRIWLLEKEQKCKPELRAWEDVKQQMFSWRNVRTVLFALLAGLAFFLVVTQPGLQSDLLGVMTGVAGMLTTLVKLRDAIVSWLGKGKPA